MEYYGLQGGEILHAILASSHLDSTGPFSVRLNWELGSNNIEMLVSVKPERACEKGREGERGDLGDEGGNWRV